MKTTAKKNQQTGLLSRSEQLGTDNRPEIDLALRRANRALETDKVLALLRSDAPCFYEIGEVVGKWVWVQFSDIRHGRARSRSVVYSQMTNDEVLDAPRCPKCNGLMVLRKAGRGAHIGETFWGCNSFPKCRGTRSE